MTALSTISSVMYLRSSGRRARCTAAGLGLAALMAGCASPEVEKTADVRLKIGFGASAETRARSQRMLSQFFFAESLLSLGWDGRPVPGLVETWEWRDAGTTLRLKLRSGLKFHDGGAVTAPLVAALLRLRVKDANGGSVPYVGGFEHVEQIDSRDDLTLDIQLRRPDSFLLGALDETLVIDDKAPDIGTGPFRITGYTPHLVAEKNPDYHRGPPAIDRVEIINYETQRSALAAMMRGEVDMVQEVARESVEFLQGASRINTYTSLRPFYIPLVFNLRHPVLGRVEVRRALLQAIDKSQIVKDAMNGHGRVAEDPVWPLHWAYTTAARTHTYNPEAARLRLDALGLPLRPAAADKQQMASRFRITCLYWADDQEFERIALLLQRQLAAVGVDVVLEPVKGDDLGARLKTGDFEMHLFRLLGGRSFDWTYRFWHSSLGKGAGIQDTGYSGADAILERLRSASGDDETRQAVADLQQRFYQDAPAAFIAWIEATRAVDESFDVGGPNDPEILANTWKWKPAEARKAQR